MTAHLELSPHQMREYGYRVIDVLVEHYSSLRGQSVVGKSDPAALQAKLQETPPERGVPFEKVLDRLSADVFANVARVNHPRFFGFVPSASNFAGVLARVLWILDLTYLKERGSRGRGRPPLNSLYSIGCASGSAFRREWTASSSAEARLPTLPLLR